LRERAHRLRQPQRAQAAGQTAVLELLRTQDVPLAGVMKPPPRELPIAHWVQDVLPSEQDG
jgi:hypothetical protein